MLIGTYHQISSKHTQRYCDEFSFRFNLRKMKDADRFSYALTAVNGRLTYKALVASNMPEQITLDHKPINRYKGVIQLQDGEIIAHYKSIKEANKLTGINKGVISRACNGKRPMGGGYVWIFA